MSKPCEKVDETVSNYILYDSTEGCHILGFNVFVFTFNFFFFNFNTKLSILIKKIYNINIGWAYHQNLFGIDFVDNTLPFYSTFI